MTPDELRIEMETMKLLREIHLAGRIKYERGLTDLEAISALHEVEKDPDLTILQALNLALSRMRETAN